MRTTIILNERVLIIEHFKRLQFSEPIIVKVECVFGLLDRNGS